MALRLPAPTFEHKIVSFEELAERRAQLPEPVVMTNGDVTYTFELVVVANPYTISTGIGFTPGP